MIYQSKKTVNSAKCPGVSYVLRRMSHGRRVKWALAMAPVLAKQADMQRELSTWMEGRDKAAAEARLLPCSCDGHAHPVPAQEPCSDCLCRHPQSEKENAEIGALEAKFADLVVLEINPALVRWGCESVKDLVIDGQPADVELLLSDGPEELVHEIASEVSKLLRLSSDETENFESPSTSGAPADGPTTGSSAPTASGAASI